MVVIAGLDCQGYPHPHPPPSFSFPFLGRPRFRRGEGKTLLTPYPARLKSSGVARSLAGGGARPGPLRSASVSAGSRLDRRGSEDSHTAAPPETPRCAAIREHAHAILTGTPSRQCTTTTLRQGSDRVTTAGKCHYRDIESRQCQWQRSLPGIIPPADVRQLTLRSPRRPRRPQPSPAALGGSCSRGRPM